MIFRQGDTTTFSMTLSEELGNNKLKLGIYTSTGKPLFETCWPDDGLIEQVDSTHYTLTIPHETTKKFLGSTTLRAAVYTQDLTLVNAGENAIVINWAAEPVTKELQ